MRVNFESAVQLSQELIIKGKWKERGHGHIVTVASLISHGAHGLSSTYSSSKHAMRAYFHSLSAEEASWLRVQVVCPGATKTALWDSVAPDGKTDIADDGVKMSPERVAHLMMRAITGPMIIFWETWIAKVSGMIWVVLAVYTSALFQGLVHFLAALRLPFWEKEGIDVLDYPTLIGAVPKLLAGKH
mmetsp:Transcript_17958/g.25885  ORF Transcript_17958/g.25885 Transcript_17958/m.25885 type:complete len:187 (-) Transcript_17958:80-640(-)